MDLVLAALPTLLEVGGQLAILGTGEPGLEAQCRGAAAAHPGRVGAAIGFDEALARLCYGGADAVLVPSRFEPCGLAQMYAQRFGSLPIVRRTGGLADTVEDGVTGFTFGEASAASFGAAVRRALEAFGQKKRLNAMRRQAMARNFGWDGAAERYAALYARAFGNNAAQRWRAA